MKLRIPALLLLIAALLGGLMWLTGGRRAAQSPTRVVIAATPTPTPVSTPPPLRFDDSVALARVDGVTITQRIFDVTVAPLSEQARELITTSSGARREHLDSLVTKALYYVMASEKGYDKAKDYVDWYQQARRSRLIDAALRDEIHTQSEALTREGLAKYVESNSGRLLRAAEARGYHNDPNFIAWLSNAQLTKLAAITFEHEVQNKVHVSDNALYDFYMRHKSLFIMPARFTQVALIVTASEGAALDAMERVRAGEDFRKIAHEESVDRQSAEYGGVLPEFVAGQERTLLRRPDPIGAMLAGAKKGEMVGPVDLSDGSGVLKLYEKEDSRQMTFSEARVDQRADFRRLLEVERRDRLVKELRERVEVEVYADRL